MRLKSVYISQYKNLKDFTLNFDGNSFIDVFVGKNGTGKSNFFEALIEIFHHLYEYDRNKDELDFNYNLSFVSDGKETNIAWTSRQFYINGRTRKTIGQTPLPDNVLIYYSGHNDTVANLVKKYEDKFRDRIKKASPDESRRFIGVGTEYKELLLAVLLMQVEGNKARQFICQKLDIDIKTIATEVILVLNRPSVIDKNLKIDPFDPKTTYWGLEGITRKFLDKLIKCIKGDFSIGELYNSEKDQYKLVVNTKLFQNKFKTETISDIFRKFDNLKTLKMLKEISISLTLKNGQEATISNFSDGQFQSVYIYSIIEIFKDSNCITLLDEPDSFLHPEWQFEFLKQIFEITDTTAQNNHVLMSSHSAATLFPLEEQTITLFDFDNSKIQPFKKSKKEIIKSLSNSLIQYSEDESKLLINNVIKSSSKPILFVEGISDVSILNTAFEKLFPDEDISVLIQDGFDCGSMRNLFAREDIFRNYQKKHFFGLFDFDKGYHEWNRLLGNLVVTQEDKGLCKKLKNKNAHVFLLPLPNNKLKSQVWDDTNPIQKVKSDCRFDIELIFWGDTKTEKYYHDYIDKASNSCTGIYFKGDKVKFAEKVIPTLDATCFEIFRPMFEFIRSHCSASVLIDPPP
jgi:predicted ATPase